MSLKKYHQKRHFKHTSEPKGTSKSTKNKHLYVIQKHAASHLHYDFRLEMNGVLLSWAVPKGPCLDPSVKRLAVHIEDHPLEYVDFEGSIPKGQYGGGTVMVWDRGEWVPESDDPLADYKKGHLKFVLKGNKLKGLWTLVRIKSNPENWLLIKSRDAYAKSLDDYDVVQKKQKSVLSKMTIEQLEKKYSLNKEASLKNKKKINNEISLTHPDKILYPEDPITKADLLDYYQKIKKWILPYIINRPLTLVRCPEGYHQSCFFQKHIDAKNSKIKSISVKGRKKIEKDMYIDHADGLFSFPQLDVLEIHTWGSSIKNIEKPDMIILDLDPAPDVRWDEVIKAALEIKKQLQKQKLISFVKTTGGKGLHIVIPIKPQYTWSDVKLFAQNFVNDLVQLYPDKYIGSQSKLRRKGKIFIDYLRNVRGATAIAPYSTRAKIHAPVATPLHWRELSARLKNTTFTLKTIGKRLEKLKQDPWKDFFKIKQSLKLKKRS